MYLAISDHVVSGVLVREDEDVQKLIYYVSKSLVQAKTLYSTIEKLVLALITSARKLRSYFNCHPIRVATTFPLKTVLQKPDLLGRMAKWVVELGEFDVRFQPRISIKSQMLADFIAKVTQPLRTPMMNKEKCGVQEMMVDGSSNQRGARVGIVRKSLHGKYFEQSLKLGFKASNNEADYEALINGLKMSLAIKILGIRVLTDSQLVVQELSGGYGAHRRELFDM